MSFSRERENYTNFHAKAVSGWLNTCSTCGMVGHKPELPEKIGETALAEYLRRFYRPLALDKNGKCEQCTEVESKQAK